MSAWSRVTVQWTAVVLGTYLIASLGVGVELAEMAFHPQHLGPDPSAPPWLRGPVTEAAIDAEDNAELRGWYIPAQHPSGAGVILLHGMADTREGIAGYAAMFLDHGYSVLLPDSRAHGASGGAFATYGVLEHDDVRRWAAWLHSRVPGCEYLFGESMGGAIAIQASAVTPGVCAVAAESSFATFREIANDRISQMTGLGLWFPHTVAAPARELALLFGELRFQVNLADASPLRAIRKSSVPTLLICGTADSNIPMRHSRELFRAGASHSEIWIVEGAEHTGAASAEPAEFEHRVIGWFAQHTVPD